MKRNHWLIIGVLAFVAAVLIMATILIVAMISGRYEGQVPVNNSKAAAAANYDLGAKGYFIEVDSLHPSDKVSSPLTLKGKARLWYFEGSFPVELKDANGLTLATGIAQAQGDWMSELMVPFVATLNFAQPTTATGTLILKKDNPSGLPQNDDQVQLAVNFDRSGSTPVAACHPGGCSGQLCTDRDDMVTTCEYLPTYACYKTATCARQADGACGWTMTDALTSCLRDAK